MNQKVKRGGRKHNKRNESLTMFSANAEGMKFKKPSLKNIINNSKVGVFTIQETHFRKKGNLKINNFEVFEAIRKKKGGGTALGVHKALNPVLIEEYSEDFEILVVEVQIRNKEIRIITGYGPRRHGLR